MYRGGGAATGCPLALVGEDGKVFHTEPAEKCFIDGTQYISASLLSAFYDITLAGDRDTLTVYFHGGNQYLTVYSGSYIVRINGDPARLSSKTIYTDDYYLPLELIKTYFKGSIIEYNKEKDRFELSRDPEEQELRLRLQKPLEETGA